MSRKSVFHELARFMPDAEREALLNKLKRSIHTDLDDRDLKLHREIGEEERKQRVEADMSKLSLFARFVLWLRSKLGGKSVGEAFLAMRLNVLKRSIQTRFPGITGFETRDLNPKLAEEVFQIFALAVPLKPHFQRVFTDPIDLQNMIVGVLETRIPRVKRTILEFVPMDRLEDIVHTTDSREALREEVGRSLNDYINAIPNKVFASVQEDMKPLERVREIILFPYTSFFQQFHFTPLEDELGRKNFFKNASAMLCLEHLEMLHYALFSAQSVPERYVLPDDILTYLQIAEEAERDPGAEGSIGRKSEEVGAPLPQLVEAADPGGADQDGVEEEGVEQVRETADESPRDGTEHVTLDPTIRNNLSKLVERCRDAYKRIPIESLIRFFMKDPYYDLVQSFYETSIKDLYVSVLRLRIVAELDRIYPEIRKRVVEREIQEMFAGKTLRTFRNYREYQSIDYRKLGLPFFSHTRSVVLLFNYVHWFYNGYIQEIVQLIDRNVLGQNRITHDRLIQYAESVEDTAERIRQFDYSLSSDSEDGRTFQRLRFTLAQDPNHQKMYRNLVLQKDREVRNIIERGHEALNGLMRVFQDLLQSNSPNIQVSMQNHYFVKGQPVSLIEIVKERINHIRKFTRIIEQVVALERS